MVKTYKILLILLALVITAYSQTTPPSGYTKNYKFRMWGQGARPSADSLNQNWKDIDSVIFEVSKKVTIDTTNIAYKNKSNYFTDENIFNGKASFELAVMNNQLIYDIDYLEPASGVYYFLDNTKPVIAFVGGGYTSVTIHGIKNHENGRILKIVNLMDINLVIKNQSNLTSYHKIYTNTGNDLTIVPRGSVELIGIDYAGQKYYLVINAQTQ